MYRRGSPRRRGEAGTQPGGWEQAAKGRYPACGMCADRFIFGRSSGTFARAAARRSLDTRDESPTELVRFPPWSGGQVVARAGCLFFTSSQLDGGPSGTGGRLATEQVHSRGEAFAVSEGSLKSVPLGPSDNGAAPRAELLQVVMLPTSSEPTGSESSGAIRRVAPSQSS
jgi:hypothetical protein